MPILRSYYQEVYRSPVVRLDGYSGRHGLEAGILAYLDFGAHLMYLEILRQIIHCHLYILAVIYMMVRIQMMFLHSKRILLLIIFRKYNFTRCIFHIQFRFHLPVFSSVSICIFRFQTDWQSVFRINISPESIGIRQTFSALCFHCKIT